MIGMMISATIELTIAPNAAPIMTPTARSTTLPFIAKSRNSFSIQLLPWLSTAASNGPNPAPVQDRNSSLYFKAFSSREPASTSLENALIDQTGMHHGATHRHARGFGDLHHREPQRLGRHS